jgi:hypothetical protein
MTQTPERRLASRIVVEQDLRPPVDILALAQRYAEVTFVAWPYKCDGMTVGLTGPGTPRIFIKQSPHVARQRFTIAHELGHVLLPWHIEEVACTPEVGESPVFRGGLREREASAFASHILVPERFLEPLCSGDVDLPLVLKAVQGAEVSASAALIALTKALGPGFAFVLGGEVFASPGTSLPAVRYDWRTVRKWSTAAVGTDRVRFGGKLIRWFKFEQHVEPQPVSDPRETTQLLKDAIAAVTDNPAEQKRLLQVVNGVIGAAMTPENRSSPIRALATMRHRIRARPDLSDLLEELDFELFLNRRANAHAAQPNAAEDGWP